MSVKLHALVLAAATAFILSACASPASPKNCDQ
ncbi:hypothetical protein JOF53_007599 [Crossiella equi]|uniref:Uncharacterized protein n=1 Tax=Crossiella equi TaxID=130796 RepID=A0ABS5AR48_9PSEU|nr:YgdI/YgdR family lipoprotein [Crossiella equi]MBP2478727.1 hypothetical protein [Crossiella equi]